MNWSQKQEEQAAFIYGTAIGRGLAFRDALREVMDYAVLESGDASPPGHEQCPDRPCPGHHPYCEGVGRDLAPPNFIAPKAKPLQDAVMDVQRAVVRLAEMVNASLPREGAS